MKTAYLCPTKEHFIYQVKEFLKTTTWCGGDTDVCEEEWYAEKNQTTVEIDPDDGLIYVYNKKSHEEEGYEIRTVELPKEERENHIKDSIVYAFSNHFKPNKPMKKYRVTKEHPFLKEGLELNSFDLIPRELEGSHTDTEYLASLNPTWFEEVDSRWKPEIGEKYYRFGINYKIESYFWRNEGFDKETWEFHNCFKTREEAEQARDKVHSLLLSLNN